MTMSEEWGIHIEVEDISAGGYRAKVTQPTSKTETQSWYIRAPSQTILLELLRPFLRVQR